MSFVRDVVDAAEPSRLALVAIEADGERREVTFGEVADSSARMAGAFAARGVGAGDVVMTVVGNRPEWAYAMLACWRIGAVAQPCSEQLRPADLRVRMEAGDARTVTAQFTAMAVEPGLRRVLRAASLSFALTYTPGPGASPALAEVRVFPGALDTAREALPPDAHVRPGAPDGADPVRVALAPQPAVSHPPAPHDAPEALAPDELEPESLELDASEADASASDLTHDWQD